MKEQEIVITMPEINDVKNIFSLINTCKPLDVNSEYCYMLLATHFQQSCVLAKQDDSTIGFLSSYIKPDAPDVLFIWQVAVHPDFRGQQISQRMFAALMTRTPMQNVRWIETTIGPTNVSSQKLFQKLANIVDAPMEVSTFATKEMFLESHEDEDLYRIGPFNPKQLLNEGI